MTRIARHALALIALIVAPAAADDTLESRLRPLIDAHKGVVAVVVKNLDTGESFAFRPDEPMPTASLIKLPVMVEAYRQAAEGKVDLKDMVTLRDADKVPGSGILTNHFSDGATFPLRDAIRLMIAYSDNTATNLVLDRIGIGSTGETMERLGYPHSKIYAKVFRASTTSIDKDKSKEFGLGSTTAAEMARLCEAIQQKEVVSPEACEAMLGHLAANNDTHKFHRFLPAGAKVAYKDGSVNASRTAAGLLTTDAGPVALCVLTDKNEDQSWTDDNAGDRLCAEVARAVYDHFRREAKADNQADAKADDPTKP